MFLLLRVGEEAKGGNSRSGQVAALKRKGCFTGKWVSLLLRVNVTMRIYASDQEVKSETLQ